MNSNFVAHAVDSVEALSAEQLGRKKTSLKVDVKLIRNSLSRDGYHVESACAIYLTVHVCSTVVDMLEPGLSLARQAVVLCSAGVVLMSTKSCGLGTDLPSISAIVLHDSDWNPR